MGRLRSLHNMGFQKTTCTAMKHTVMNTLMKQDVTEETTLIKAITMKTTHHRMAREIEAIKQKAILSHMDNLTECPLSEATNIMFRLYLENTLEAMKMKVMKITER